MKSVFLVITVAVFLIVGEIRCIVKAFSCNYEPIGKAEICYITGSVTGLGCIVGWIDIEDK